MFDEYIGKRVIVRTYSAGVHFGTMIGREGKDVHLNDARRIWEWRGAFTLSAVAEKGITGGRISISVPTILLTEAIEIIPCSDASAAILTKIEAHKP